MANSNRRSWRSNRPRRGDPTQKSRSVPPSTTSAAGGQADGFVESADFLPDWLATEPAKTARANPEPSPPAEQSDTLHLEEADELISRLEVLDQMYASEPAATPDLTPAAPVSSIPSTPTTPAFPTAITQPPLVNEALPAADDTGANSEGLSNSLNHLESDGETRAVVDEVDKPLDELLGVGHQSIALVETAEPPADQSEPVVAIKSQPEVQSLPTAVPATAEAEPVSARLAVPVVSAAANQPAAPRPSPQLTPAVATSGYATPSRATSVVRQPARKAIQSAERGRPRRQRTRKVLLEGGLQRVPVRLFDRFARVSLLLVLLFGLLSFLILRFNPFAYFAIQSATAARPQTVRPAVDAPGEGSEWCLTGDFLDNQRGQVFSDNGLVGDTIAGDRVFSLEQTIARPGTYFWQVAACNDPDIVFPSEPTWVVTTRPNQTVLFTADASQRGIAHFVSTPYVVAANDSAASFRVIGDFQDWDRDDPSSTLERVGVGIYQHVRRFSQPDQYNAYVVATGPEEGEGLTAFDGYGRTTAPIPLTFRTMRRGDTAVFLLDLNKGRATVLYNMNPFLTQMAYYGGNWIAGLLSGAAALVIFLWLLLRSGLIWRHGSWLDSGCPRCHEHELMRVERQLVDRLLHSLGLPTYRYQCRQCTWQGLRLSVGGLSASPRSRLARR